MSLDPREVEKIAELARIELGEDEIAKLTVDCLAILDHFKVVRRIDLADVDPTGAVESSTPLREDRVDFDRLERSLELIAPDWREGYFVVPRLPAMDSEVVGDEGES